MIHPVKEMEVSAKDWSYDRAITEGVLTGTQIGNFTRARVHGLIARSKDNPGNWLLTKKGASFLRGDEIPRLAIIEKSRRVEGGRSHKQDYYLPDIHRCTIHDITKRGSKVPMWEGIDFDIFEGRIVFDTKKEAEQMPLL